MVQVNYGDGEESIADMLKNTLETYPALKGIFCTNEDMADQTLDALADMENTEQIQIVGFDSGEKQQKAIQEGREYGTVTQNPYGLGYAAIVAAVRAIQGLPVDQKIDTGYQWLDKARSIWRQIRSIFITENQDKKMNPADKGMFLCLPGFLALQCGLRVLIVFVNSLYLFGNLLPDRGEIDIRDAVLGDLRFGRRGIRLRVAHGSFWGCFFFVKLLRSGRFCGWPAADDFRKIFLIVVIVRFFRNKTEIVHGVLRNTGTVRRFLIAAVRISCVAGRRGRGAAAFFFFFLDGRGSKPDLRFRLARAFARCSRSSSSSSSQ